jgi:hypothetical protein
MKKGRQTVFVAPIRSTVDVGPKIIERIPVRVHELRTTTDGERTMVAAR